MRRVSESSAQRLKLLRSDMGVLGNSREALHLELARLFEQRGLCQISMPRSLRRGPHRR